jgi:hypothetical protein
MSPSLDKMHKAHYQGNLLSQHTIMPVGASKIIKLDVAT